MNQRATETTLINTLIDNMNMKDFRQYVWNDMKDFLYKCSESELINEISYTLDDEMLEEFLTTIKSNSLPYNDTKA